MKNERKTSKTMNVLLWAAQVLLAVGFIWAGSMKLFQSPEKLAEMWPWTIDDPGLVKITGVLDLLAAFGLILPSLLRVQTKLTVWAAYGTIALMIAAGIFHISRGEASQIGVNIFFLVFAVFIARGRQKEL